MRVGLDARALASEQISGVERYVTDLTLALAKLERGPEIIAYTDRPIGDLEIARAVSAHSLRTRMLRARHGWLRAALPWRLWRDGVDLVHLPSTIIPPILPCPAVVTVHDLAWTRYPEIYAAADLAMQHRAVAGAAARAARIIAVSESTARDLRHRYPGAVDKIMVVPLGVSAEFSPEGPPLSPAAFAGAGKLRKGYILYTGGLLPRKNLLRLVAAYSKVLSEGPAPPLVLAGARTAHAEELAAVVRELGIERQVIFTGYVQRRDLPALYRGAGIFVYPSLYEGFGLPVLEAMASGAPVVTTNVSSMPEVAEEAAVLVDPESVDRLAWAISLYLTDEELGRTMTRRGLARSREFTWEQTARKTVEVYKLAAGAK